MGYIYTGVTILFGFLLAMIACMTVSWLKLKADTPDTRLDDLLIAAIGNPLQVTIVAVSFSIALKYYLPSGGCKDEKIIPYPVHQKTFFPRCKTIHHVRRLHVLPPRPASLNGT
jgi:hypothetical protein